jgi:transposase
MARIKLNEEQYKDLQQIHDQVREKKYADRIKAVMLLADNYSYDEIARILFIDQSSVRRYEKLFMHGTDRLLANKYRGRIPNLKPEQIIELREHIESHLYACSKDICKYVQEKYGVNYTKDGLVLALKRWGFVWKKTRLTPPKVDEETQREHVKKYEEISSHLKEDEKIYFLDGVHPTHNSMPGRAWIKKGDERALKSNTGRQRININGAYSPRDHEVVIREDERINAESTIKLLQMIENKHPELNKIYVFADNARYYYSRAVKEYLRRSKIQMIHLPAYCPNLNLIERLWKFFKKKVLYNRYYGKYLDFRNATMQFFEKDILTMKNELDKLMTERFHIVKNEQIFCNP